MKKRNHRTTFILLGLLIAAVLAGWFFTMDAGVALTQRVARRMARSNGQETGSGTGSGSDAAANAQPLVDEQPLITAQALARSLDSSSTIEERHYADRAVQIADHELDQAFATALREAAHQTKSLTPQQREVHDRVQKLEAQVQGDQQRVDKLMKSAGLQGSASIENLPDDLQQQINLAQAQLAIDQDNLDDAKLVLARLGGDASSKIQRLLQEHEASEHTVDSAAQSTGESQSTDESQGERAPVATAGGGKRPEAPASEPSHLFGLVRAWSALQSQKSRILQAQQEAMSAMNTLAQSHQALEQQIKEGQLKKEPARKEPEGASASTQDSGQSASAAGIPASTSVATQDLAALRRLGDDRKTLAEYSKRLQDEQYLAEIYRRWADFVSLRQRVLVHRILQAGIVILAILLLVAIADRFIDHIFATLTAERKRLVNLHGVAIFIAQATGVAVIALVVFGFPSQLPTVLGLAGAGLTVALKDFIVGFIGWFILMGKNGIRVGDWVEIHGVGGEVIEIDLLRTVLMETGNWNDAGHPTGRKVSFVNSYAIEGHYFNFSTTGQWLWDELPVLIPIGVSPYSIIDGVQQIVAEETAGDTKLAEEEWRRVTEPYGVNAFSAAPSIDLRPTTFGIEVTVKYITRANERYELRARLNQRVVKLLHEKSATAGAIAPIVGVGAQDQASDSKKAQTGT